MKLQGLFVGGASAIRWNLKIRYPAIEYTRIHLHLSLGNAQPDGQISPILYGADYFPDDALRHFPSYHIFLTSIQQYT